MLRTNDGRITAALCYAPTVMSASTFDALTAAREFEAAGMDRAQAEAVAVQLHAAAGAGRDDLATKADLAHFATKADLAHFATKEDLVRFATKADLAHFATKEDVANAVNRMLLAQLAIAGLLFAALKLF